MAIGEGCFEECYGDFMTTGGGDYDYAAGRQDNGGMGIVDFAEVTNGMESLVAKLIPFWGRYWVPLL